MELNICSFVNLKTVVWFSLLFISLSCKTTSNFNLNEHKKYDNEELNIEMNASQLKSIESSPFQSAKSMTKELETQLLFRKKYVDVIHEIKAEYPKNPIVILESYDFKCSGCPADYVNLFNNEIFISYYLEKFSNKPIDKMQYLQKERVTDFKNTLYYDMKIIYDNLERKTKWNSNPTEYGVEIGCSDGGNSFYSVYFPNGSIESMYMRCWTATLNKN